MSVDLTTIQEQLGDYVCEVSPVIYSKMMTGSPTMSSDCFTAHEGVKGSKVLTQLQVFGNLKKWNCKFEPKDIATYIPKIITTHLGKCDWTLCPQDYESSYLGQFRRQGQQGADFPFAQYLIDMVIKHINTGMDVALWNAVLNPAATNDADFTECFNGWLPLIANAVAEGELENVVVTAASMVDTIESMYAALPAAYKSAEICVHVSCATYQQYFTDYRERFGKNCCGPDRQYEGLTLDVGSKNVKLMQWPGMQESDGIIMAPKGALHYGYDARNDKDIIRMQQDKRELCFMTDFRLGAQIALEDCFVVNDAFLGGK